MPKGRTSAGKEIHFYYVLAVSTELLAVSTDQKKKKTEIMFLNSIIIKSKRMNGMRTLKEN